MSAEKRAPRGLGSIRQRKNGRWQWQADLGKDPATGRRIRLTRERATRENALDAGRQALLQHNRPDRLSPAPVPGTVADWYTHWLRLVAARPDGSPNTYANYEGQVRRRILPAIGHMQMSDVATGDIKKLLDTIKTQPSRYAVRKTLARGWREAFDAEKVHDKDVVERAPVKPETTDGRPVARGTTPEAATNRLKALLASPPAPVRESMRAGDMTRIFATLETERLRARFILNLVTGPRQSEVLGLCWPWLRRPADPAQPGVIYLHTTRIRELYAHGCHEMSPCGTTPHRCPRRVFLDPYKEPKTAGSTRYLYLGPGVMELLADWEGLQTIELSRLASPPEIPWMFTQASGSPLSHSVDAKLWARILNKAGVSRHYTLHDLRRTAASEAAADPNIDKPTLMGMFGWARESTADLYIRPQDERLQRAFRRQDDRFSASGQS